MTQPGTEWGRPLPQGQGPSAGSPRGLAPQRHSAKLMERRRTEVKGEGLPASQPVSGILAKGGPGTSLGRPGGLQGEGKRSPVLWL